MEHVALYRLFRPMNFDEIVEQEHAVAALRQSVISGKIGHAYLFCGTRGTGKTSIAKVFSRAINCLHPINGNPCNECEICKGVIDGSLLDVIEMDAASNNSVDNIRRICDEVMFMPAKAKYKVYIIDEVHMLSTGAFNALLKTLEEPPAHAVFLLATTEPHRIPATILSRCQRYDFRRISNESIVKRLEHIASKQNISIEKDALSAIATIGDGALRDSVSLLDQVSTTSLGKTITRDDILKITGVVDETFLNKFAAALLEGRAADVLPLCRELMMDGRDLIRFTLDLAQYFRNILVTKVSTTPSTLIDSTTAAISAMTELGRRTDSTSLLFFIMKLSDLTGELKWSPSVRTSFEITMLRLASRGNKIVPAVIPQAAKAPASAPAAATPEPVEEKKAPLVERAEPVEKPVEAKQPSIAESTASKEIPAIAQMAPPPVVDLTAPPKPTPAIAKPVAPKTPEPPKAEPLKEEKTEPVAVSAAPSLDDISLPPPPLAENVDIPTPPPTKDEMVPPPVSEDDFLPPPPTDEDFMPPPPPPPAPEPTAAELAATAPSSPNLHKAFASTHKSEGQVTNLSKATRGPEIREPHLPRTIVMPDGMESPASEEGSTQKSNVRQVFQSSSSNPCADSQKEFMDYLMANHSFEYMFMTGCRLVWKDRTIWCILPDAQEGNMGYIREDSIIDTNLLNICQRYEPSLIHVKFVTEKNYNPDGDDGDTQTASPSQPDWVSKVKSAAEKGNVTVTTVENM
ncbi:MAG: DNA polymerase III subunit gamma/tau [Clostridiales bacterium]|nr:DNA polymerase III subunit gamma/tau [Clostridiales bacterium]